MPRYKKDLAGLTFGRLVVLSFDGIDPIGRHSRWLCKCSCGNIKSIRMASLQAGTTKSCGCINSEWVKSGQMRRSHGKCGTKIYRIYRAMLNRCYRKNDLHYSQYGGRGISVCREWKDSFAQFYKDMGDPPSVLHSLDRINNDGNYSKDNCKWSTRTEQANNRRTNVIVEYMGEVGTLAEVGRALGLPPHSLRKKIGVKRLVTRKADSNE